MVTEDAFSDEVSDNADGRKMKTVKYRQKTRKDQERRKYYNSRSRLRRCNRQWNLGDCDGEVQNNDEEDLRIWKLLLMDWIISREFSDGLFSSGDNMTETEQRAPVLEEENTEAAAASFESVDEEAHKATLLYTRWKQFGKAWKLSKLPKGKTVQENTAPDTGDVQQPTDNTEATEQEIPDDTAVPEVPADVMTVPRSRERALSRIQLLLKLWKLCRNCR